MINFHRLATVAESLRYSLKEDISVTDDNVNNAIYNKEEKDRLYNNLLKMNDEEETVEKKFRKLSDDEKESTQEKFNVNLNIEGFNKYISNFCTVYLDFDSFSDNLLSSLVGFLLTF
jgi:hypothetical protein